MSRDDLDLDAYLERIRTEAGPPNEETLARIVHGHARAIPFEDLDIHRGLPIRLDVPSLVDKLVRRRRGGYCFEHNTLLLHVLQALGFAVRPLAGRVRYIGPTLLPRTHMLLLVEIGARSLLADVGFGGRNLREPIPFVIGETIVQGRESYRLDREPDGVIALSSLLPEGPRALYAFGLEPQHAPDFEMANWYTSTHPSSRFVNHKIAARIGDGQRVSLVDRDLRIVTTHADGSETVQTREIEPGRAYLDVLRELFAIDLPEDPPLRWA
jgi:N-hydroxyarylamine O-acetyltransferase